MYTSAAHQITTYPIKGVNNHPIILKSYRLFHYLKTEPILSLPGYPGQSPDSEFVYLKEIILVDDNSTLAELKGKLSHYIRTRLPPGIVKVLRLPER